MATLTVRVVRSLRYRTVKNLVLHDIDLETTTAGQLKTMVREEVSKRTGWKGYQNLELDTLKIYSQAQGAKSMNLSINLGDDETLLLSDDNKTLHDSGCRHETELSFFKMQEYNDFVANPEQSW